MAIAKVMLDGIASTLALERLGQNGHRRIKKRPIADFDLATFFPTDFPIADIRSTCSIREPQKAISGYAASSKPTDIGSTPD